MKKQFDDQEDSLGDVYQGIHRNYKEIPGDHIDQCRGLSLSSTELSQRIDGVEKTFSEKIDGLAETVNRLGKEMFGGKVILGIIITILLGNFMALVVPSVISTQPEAPPTAPAVQPATAPNDTSPVLQPTPGQAPAATPSPTPPTSITTTPPGPKQRSRAARSP